MAIFPIETATEIVDVEADTVEEAIREVQQSTGLPAKLYASAAPQPAPTPVASQETPTGLPAMQAIKETLTTPIPGTETSISQALTMPQRGMRGLGVGLQRLAQSLPPGALSGPAPFSPALSPADVSGVVDAAPEALNRAAAATQPGYVPQEGESAGAALGEAVGGMPLGMALGGPVGVGKGLLAKSLFGGLSAGTFDVINQASERGDIEINFSTVAQTAGGGLLPLAMPTGKWIKNVLRENAEISAERVGVGRAAVAEARQNARILKDVDASADAVKGQIEFMQMSAKDMVDESGTQLGKYKQKKLGLPMYSDEVTEAELRALESGELELRPIDEITIQFRAFTDPKGIGLTPKNRLKQLVDLRDQIDQRIKFDKAGKDLPKKAGVGPLTREEQATLKRMAKQINKTIYDPAIDKGLPGGKELRELEAMWSESRELYDILQNKMSTRGQAESLIYRIAQNESPDEILGLSADAVDAIRALERRTGKVFLKPFQQTLAARSFKNAKATNIRGSMKVGHGGEDLRRIIAASDSVGSGIAALGKAISSPTGRAAIISTMPQAPTLAPEIIDKLKQALGL